MGELTNTIGQFWKAIEAGDLDGADEVLTDDVVFEFPGMRLDGRDAVKQMIQGWLAAFPDLQHEVVEEFESDGNYACRLILRGTHTGPFVTPNGEIPATGRSITFASADYITGAGGKASRWFAYPDMAGLIAQIS